MDGQEDAKRITYIDGESEIDFEAVKERVGDRVVFVVDFENINKLLFDSPVWLLVCVAGHRFKIILKLIKRETDLRPEILADLVENFEFKSLESKHSNFDGMNFCSTSFANTYGIVQKSGRSEEWKERKKHI